MTQDQKAKAFMVALTSVWANWSDEFEEDRDNALQMLCEAARGNLDMHQVSGQLASPLNYFIRSRLDEDNPEDLTYGEMMHSMTISLGL